MRGVGVMPLAAAVLSTPAVWACTQRLARAGGSALRALGQQLWDRTRSLLSRGGPTGQRAAQALASTGTTVARAASAALTAVTTRPGMRPVLHALSAVGGLVRPASHALVGHRLIRLLPAARWVQVALELLLLPLLAVVTMPAPPP